MDDFCGFVNSAIEPTFFHQNAETQAGNATKRTLSVCLDSANFLYVSAFWRFQH